jgi:alanyl-tRNA synthetase
MFKIISEGSVAAGMRRIEALTGEVALKYVQENDELLTEIQQFLNSSRKTLIDQLEKLKQSLKESEKEAKSLRQKIANLKFKTQEEEIRRVKDISVLVKRVDGMNESEFRELADSLQQRIGSGVVILGTVIGKKVLLVAAVTKDLVKRIEAKEVIQRIAPVVGGGGGGRADFAQAGGKKPEHLNQALKDSYMIIEEMIK